MDNLSCIRIESLRAEMAQLDIDYYLVRDTVSIRWLTAIDGVFDSERAHTLLVERSAQNGATLHTDSRYSLAIAREAQKYGTVRVDESVVSLSEFVAAHIRAGARVGIEADMPLNEYRALNDACKAEFIPIENTIINLRACKDESEIARMNEAQKITDAAFEHIVQYIADNPNSTERQVALELEYAMLRGGAEGLSFPSIVASGARSACPHAIPTDNKLQWGTPVVIDFGCVYQGYCSDMTRTVFLGEPTPQVVRAYAAIRAANETVEQSLKPGVLGKDMQQLAEDILAEYGFAGAMGHGLGHGVGLVVHEQPNLNSRNDLPLQTGNVVTVEPGIYLGPGNPILEPNQAPFGMRLEDFGVITDVCFHKFTQYTHDAVIIHNANL